MDETSEFELTLSGEPINISEAQLHAILRMIFEKAGKMVRDGIIEAQDAETISDDELTLIVNSALTDSGTTAGGGLLTSTDEEVVADEEIAEEDSEDVGVAASDLYLFNIDNNEQFGVDITNSMEIPSGRYIISTYNIVGIINGDNYGHACAKEIDDIEVPYTRSTIQISPELPVSTGDLYDILEANHLLSAVPDSLREYTFAAEVTFPGGGDSYYISISDHYESDQHPEYNSMESFDCNIIVTNDLLIEEVE